MINLLNQHYLPILQSNAKALALDSIINWLDGKTDWVYSQDLSLLLEDLNRMSLSIIASHVEAVIKQSKVHVKKKAIWDTKQFQDYLDGYWIKFSEYNGFELLWGKHHQYQATSKINDKPLWVYEVIGLEKGLFEEGNLSSSSSLVYYESFRLHPKYLSVSEFKI